MNGFVFLNKEEGMTSFAAVAKLRRIFSTKKVGHTGTLDPMATGVLVVAVGNATRFIELVPDHDKAYVAKFRLGVTTDTLDITGKVLSECSFSVTKKEVENAVLSFSGNIKQVPPMFSALKKDGVRLYELARQGIEIEREERDVEIKRISVSCIDEQKGEYELFVHCSKGTYIRSLIGDIGEKLGAGAVMTALERVKANSVDIERCFSFSALAELKENGKEQTALVCVEEFLPYKKITVSALQAKRFSNGGELALERVRGIVEDTYYLVFSPENEFLGVGEKDTESGNLKVKKVYVR